MLACSYTNISWLILCWGPNQVTAIFFFVVMKHLSFDFQQNCCHSLFLCLLGHHGYNVKIISKGDVAKYLHQYKKIKEQEILNKSVLCKSSAIKLVLPCAQRIWEITPQWNMHRIWEIFYTIPIQQIFNTHLLMLFYEPCKLVLSSSQKAQCWKMTDRQNPKTKKIKAWLDQTTSFQWYQTWWLFLANSARTNLSEPYEGFSIDSKLWKFQGSVCNIQ